MKKYKVHRWLFTFAGIGGVIGMTGGQLIQGKFDFSVFLGAFTALVIAFIVDVVRMRIKKDDTPDFDERTVNNMQKFYFYLSHIFVGIVFVTLAIITFIGVKEISINYLWTAVILYFIISGVGALIVSRK